MTACVTTPPAPSAPKQTKHQASNQPALPFSMFGAFGTSPSVYPKHIALLLPLQGQFASTSQAIRNGFLAADYQAKQQGSSPLSIKVYDTSGKNIQAVYQQALSEEADFVVGPLPKPDVTALANSDIRVPTLALNVLDNSTTPNNAHLFQFGLSPKDEIIQAADKAWQEGHRRAIFITSKDEWGQSIQETFRKHWESLGGTVIANLSFAHNEKDFFNPIRELLVDKELANAQKLEDAKIKGKKLHRVPPARQDIDVVFLAALPNQARQIYPAINFFYAEKIPVYATSSIYSGAPNTFRDQDLNGIRFADMPWVLNPTALPQPFPEIYNYITTQWPLSTGFQNKFYAFGIDAFHLTAYLLQPENFPSDGIQAATGTLYLKSDRHIYRQLQWTTIHNGSI